MGGNFSTKSSPEANKFIQDELKQHQIVVFSKSYCPYCTKGKRILNSMNVPYQVIELDARKESPTGGDIQNELANMTGRRTVPNIFIGGTSIGGGDDVERMQRNGELKKRLVAIGMLNEN